MSYGEEEAFSSYCTRDQCFHYVHSLQKPLPRMVLEQLGGPHITEQHLDLLVPRHFLHLGNGRPGARGPL